MTSTKQDLDQIRPLSKRVTRTIDRLLPVIGPPLRLLCRIGLIGRWLSRTTGGRFGAISRHAKRGEHDKAAEIAIEAMRESRHLPESRWGPNGRDFWWRFMFKAAENIYEIGDREKMGELMEMARDGVQPFKGYAVARAYLIFSRWSFKTGDVSAATTFAEAAIQADPTWAEPNCLLGWYCLSLGNSGAIDHLTRAVEKEPSILFRIAKDPLFRLNPHIIAKLKEQIRTDRLP